MKILTCPLNGPRNISEFVYGGEYRKQPDPETSTKREWSEYVFFNENHAGVVTEWWCHAASSYWFLAHRNTMTDEILQTFDVSEIESHFKARSASEKMD